MSPDDTQIRDELAADCFVAIFRQSAAHEIKVPPGTDPMAALHQHWFGVASASFIAANAFVAARAVFSKSETTQ